MLVEEANCLGGTSTAGGLSEWFAALEGIGDIFERALELLDQFGARKGRFYNPEILKIVWQLLAEEAGVQILFHSTLHEVITANRRVAGVKLLACSRPLAASARFFIEIAGRIRM